MSVCVSGALACRGLPCEEWKFKLKIARQSELFTFNRQLLLLWRIYAIIYPLQLSGVGAPRLFGAGRSAMCCCCNHRSGAKARSTMPGFLFNGNGRRDVYSRRASSIICIDIPLHAQYVHTPVHTSTMKKIKPLQ